VPGAGTHKLAPKKPLSGSDNVAGGAHKLTPTTPLRGPRRSPAGEQQLGHPLDPYFRELLRRRRIELQRCGAWP